MNVSIFSEKPIVSVLMKHLTPISFGLLKSSIPEFFRCSLIRNTSFINFFRQKLRTNLIIYFGQTKEAVDWVNFFMMWLESGTQKILTGSFLLHTLNGDDINLCGDIDIITNVYDNYFEYMRIKDSPTGIFFLNQAKWETPADFVKKWGISTEFANSPYLGYNKDDVLRDICNITVNMKKIQLLNITEENQINYINRFDLKICQNYYYTRSDHHTNEREYRLKVLNLQSILRRKLNINVSQTYLPRVIIVSWDFINSLCKSIYSRLCKYKSRNFDILIWTDFNTDNVSIGSNHDHQTLKELTDITGHVCDSKCVENNGCTLFNIADYVFKKQIIAVWRDFWYHHTDENLRILHNSCYSCSPQTKKVKLHRSVEACHKMQYGY